MPREERCYNLMRIVDKQEGPAARTCAHVIVVMVSVTHKVRDRIQEMSNTFLRMPQQLLAAGPSFPSTIRMRL